MNTPEYEIIVEFSYNEKQEVFVVRFLNGASYCLSVTSLPKKMQTKKPEWPNAELSPGRTSLVLTMEKEIREIPAHMIHARGTAI